MIERLTNRNVIDVFEFVQRVKDNFEDFYVTHENQRLFLTDLKLISKLIEKQEIYSIYDKGVKNAKTQQDNLTHITFGTGTKIGDFNVDLGFDVAAGYFDTSIAAGLSLNIW